MGLEALKVHFMHILRNENEGTFLWKKAVLERLKLSKRAESLGDCLKITQENSLNFAPLSPNLHDFFLRFFDA